MAKYLKTIPIEADQYKIGMEDGIEDIQAAVKNGLSIDNYVSPIENGKAPFINTLEGKHYISKDDFIITGVNKERYPCKKDIFLKTYMLIT